MLVAPREAVVGGLIPLLAELCVTAAGGPRPVARPTARDGRQERAVGRAGQAAVRHRFAALAALDRPGRHPRTSPVDRPAAAVAYTFADERSWRQSPGRRSDDPPNVLRSRTSAIVQTAARQAHTTAVSTRPTIQTTTNRRTAARTRTASEPSPSAVPTAVQAMAAATVDRHQDDDQGQRREPEAHGGREGMVEARPDRATQSDRDAVAIEGDPSSRDRADHLADHPGQDEHDQHVGRRSERCERRSTPTRPTGSVSSR